MCTLMSDFYTWNFSLSMHLHNFAKLLNFFVFFLVNFLIIANINEDCKRKWMNPLSYAYMHICKAEEITLYESSCVVKFLQNFQNQWNFSKDHYTKSSLYHIRRLVFIIWMLYADNLMIISPTPHDFSLLLNITYFSFRLCFLSNSKAHHSSEWRRNPVQQHTSLSWSSVGSLFDCQASSDETERKAQNKN